MKKNIAMRLASLILMCTIVTSCFVSTTFAKYTSSASGTDSAVVAKWAIDVEGTEIAVTGSKPTITFDLFNTIKDSDGSSAETDVKADKIAPGTSGAFELDITNNSDVNAMYGIKFTPSGAAVPIQYSIDGKNWSTSIPEIVADATTTKIEMGKSATVNVQWKWAYERDGKDAEDTSLGIAAGTVTVTAELAVTQID